MKFFSRLTHRFTLALLLGTTSTDSSHAASTRETFAIFKSTDRGRSWLRSDHGLPGDSRVNALEIMGEGLFAGTDSGIFISRNEGASWKPSTRDAVASTRVLCFAALGNSLYAGTDGDGILVTADGGATWLRMANYPFAQARCLLANDGDLYAGTDAKGVLKSSDGGKTWSSHSEGLPSHAQIFTMSAVQGTLFAGLYSKGLFRWDGGEGRWRKMDPVTPLVMASVGDTLVVGHNPGGIQWSDDWGANWHTGNAASPLGFSSATLDSSQELAHDDAIWKMAAGDGLVMAGAADGIFVSEDRGRTWVRARTGLPAESPGVSFLIKDDVILAGVLIKDVSRVANQQCGRLEQGH